jgi:hypothetical protein
MDPLHPNREESRTRQAPIVASHLLSMLPSHGRNRDGPRWQKCEAMKTQQKDGSTHCAEPMSGLVMRFIDP